MTNHPFTRFGIDHLSCSSLNLWRASPGIWGLRYLGNIKDEGNAAMWRGNAVENGFSHILRGTNLAEASKLAVQAFDLNSQGELSDEIQTERDLISPMLKQCSEWQPPATLAATQLRVEHWLEDVPIPLIGFLDFAFEEIDVDLKTTKACPSKPRPDHVRQVSFYRAARQKQGGILYVTDKRKAYYQIDDAAMDRALNDLQTDAICLMNFLARCDTKQDVFKSLPIDYDSFLAPKTKIPFEQLLMAG